MILRPPLCLFVFLWLTPVACSTVPQVDWPAGPIGPTPALIALDGAAVTGSTLDARGAALAAQAAALRARTAAMGR